MSSGPVGLDSREYQYQYFMYQVPDAALHFITAENQWLVTKIQVFMGANAGQFFISGTPSPPIPLAANGCLTLEPNGAYRSDMSIQGQDAMIIIEFWIQSNPNGPILPRVI